MSRAAATIAESILAGGSAYCFPERKSPAEREPEGPFAGVLPDGFTWRIFGYHADASDATTDYYSPAYWHGIAEAFDAKGEPIGLRIVSDGYGRTWNDPVPVVTHGSEPGEPCTHCSDGIEPDLRDWPLSRAQADPEGYHRAEEACDWSVGTSLYRSVVSPIPFSAWDSETGEHYRHCHVCQGRGHWLRPTETWHGERPGFFGLAKGDLVHVETGTGEHDSLVIRAFRGAATIDRARWAKPGSPEAEKRDTLLRRIAETVRQATRPPATATSPCEGFDVRPGKRPGYVDVAFSEKPDEATRDALKASGFRWARSYGVWYGHEDRLPDCLRCEGTAS